MGTHPIFESDFDCLTELMSDDDSLVDLDELDRILKDAGSSKVKTSNEWNAQSKKENSQNNRAAKSIDDFLKEFSDDDDEAFLVMPIALNFSHRENRFSSH